MIHHIAQDMISRHIQKIQVEYDLANKSGKLYAGDNTEPWEDDDPLLESAILYMQDQFLEADKNLGIVQFELEKPNRIKIRWSHYSRLAASCSHGVKLWSPPIDVLEPACQFMRTVKSHAMRLQYFNHGVTHFFFRADNNTLIPVRQKNVIDTLTTSLHQFFTERQDCRGTVKIFADQDHQRVEWDVERPQYRKDVCQYKTLGDAA